MPFRPPTGQAFRRFVALDAPEIMSALSALDGGAVDEILTRRVGEKGGELGAELGISGAKAKGKRGKSQRVEEELRRVRTEHSAAAALLDRMLEREAVGTLEGTLDAEALENLEPGMVVQIQCKVAPHPVFQVDTVMRSFIANAPKLGAATDAKELRGIMPMWQALTGTTDAGGRVLLDLLTGSDQAARVVAFVARSALQVPLEEIAGHFTVLAQVDEVMVGPDAELVSLRLVRGAPPGGLERQGITEMGEHLVEAAGSFGVALSMDDLVMPAPLVVLRPLCIWR